MHSSNEETLSGQQQCDVPQDFHRSGYNAVSIPPNLITTDSTEITPEMLPLITLSQTDIDTIVAQVPGGVANIQDIYELSPLQSGLLYHHLMANKSDPYFLAVFLRFVDRSSLEDYTIVMKLLTERHDILRTAFFWEGLSKPAQVVMRQVPTMSTEITLDKSDETALEQLKKKFVQSCECYDLTQAPLLHSIFARESDGSWVALQFVHHSVCDLSSVEKLQTEVHAIMSGKIAMLKTPTPFRNFVAHARFGINLADHQRFFTEMLGDIDEPTMPFGSNDVGQSGAGINEEHLQLPKTLNDRLRAHAKSLQVSLASICHLAWAQVLARASGHESVVFGTVIRARLQAGQAITTIIGPIINTLPLRLNIDDRSIETAVRDTHSQIRALLAHQHAPLVLAQRCSGIPVNLPLFSALLNYRHYQNSGMLVAPNSSIGVIKFEDRAEYPFTLSIADDGSSLNLTAQVISCKSAAQINAYMQQALISLSDALTHSPEQPVRTLNVMPPEERTMLLHDWNRITVSNSSDCCLHQLFEAQVERDGQVIAVECDGQILSYAELNTHANQLAHYLISKGVKPDDRIALCAERSTTMIVAMLAILKAGCAYVPLDPVYPSQRLTNTLLDADPVYLLADATGRKAFGQHQVPVVELEKPLPAGLSSDNPGTTILGLNPAHLAYVIYTSGSTGTPKGVMVEHRQVVRLFEAARDKYDFNKQDKWCLFHSISFDVSVWEMWSAFFYGSQLSIVPCKITRSADELYVWICINGINVLCQTPSAFKLLMRAKKFNSRCDHLRYIILAGEELDPLIAKEWFKKYHATGTILNNMYGPTETTVYATFQRLHTLEDVHSIGRPLPDLRVYLLNAYGEPVPLGAEGEIYISGARIARGYLNRIELTAERFLPDPFSGIPGTRMYRTGDRARYLPDGNLVFLGRIDQQVKIRGFRIELGEIEARLIEHSDVHEAVVQPYNNGPDTRLIAYVVADEDASLAQNLRSYLSNLLPEYMVPVAYVRLQSLPITQSGKLDRSALPAPDENAFPHQLYEAPFTGLERVIADIWQSLLDIDRVGRHDHFFELGGHSLLAINAVNLINHAINDQLSVSDIFAAPTVKQLAQRIKSQNRSRALVDLQENAILPEDIQPLSSVEENSSNAILLTGATGFVGRFLLRQLLDTTHSEIYCLVRGKNQADSQQRLKHIMNKWSLWREVDEQRIIVLHGDIKINRLGLDEQTYAKLSREVSVIFHSAVSMNHLETFDMAYQANVFGLVELLRLATKKINKIMNFVSTFSVFSAVDQIGHRVVDESSEIENERHFADQGYAASKWVGEKIVSLAVDRGIACNIFRLGLITADSELARYDELQTFHRLLKSSIQMGMAFEDFGGDIILTPVDFTAKALVHLGFMYNSAENIFHVSDMMKISRRDFIEKLNVHLPEPMAIVSSLQWLSEARRRHQRGETLPISPVIHEIMMFNDEELDNFGNKAKISWDSTKTLEKLIQADIKLPTYNNLQWYRLFVDSLTK